MNDHLTHELLVELQSGNVEAAGILYALCREEFYKSARKRTLSREDAEDAINTAFKKLLEATSNNNYDPTRAGGSRWMWSIFNNAVWDILRRKPTEELTDELIENGLRSELNDFNPVERTEDQEIQELVRRAFRQLSETDRQELLRGRGKRGQKRASLRRAEEHLRTIFHEMYEGGLLGDP